MVIHGGLETGIFAEKLPEMQMVALGPDIENAHTPQERVNIASVAIEFEIVLNIVKHMNNELGS